MTHLAGEEVEGPSVGTYEGSDGGKACMGGFRKKVFSDSPEVRTKHCLYHKIYNYAVD